MANTVSEFRIGQNTSERLVPIIVNTYGDKIYIDINNTTFVNKVINLYQWFEGKQDEVKKIQAAIDKADAEQDIIGAKDALEALTNLYREMAERFDMVFGEGTIRKYFRPLYEAFGDDFVPDDECFEDFIDEITPVLNKLFELREKRIEKKYSKKKRAVTNRTHNKTKQELIDEAIEKKEENA